jgi:hypothetical protein
MSCILHYRTRAGRGVKEDGRRMMVTRASEAYGGGTKDGKAGTDRKMAERVERRSVQSRDGLVKTRRPPKGAESRRHGKNDSPSTASKRGKVNRSKGVDVITEGADQATATVMIGGTQA